MEGDVLRHYRMIRVAKRADLRSITRVRDRGKKEIKNRSVSIKVTGQT